MELRKCVKCEKEKEVGAFRRQKKWFTHTCKECYASKYRTGKVNLGRFPKGHIPTHGFKKGQISLRRGIPLSKETKEKLSLSLKGRTRTPEVIEKVRQALLNSPNKFRDGKGRRCSKSIQWSISVRSRDGNKCTRCERTENLHAHHIVPWRISEELRYEISNGITLCSSCHTKEERRCFPKGAWNKGKKLSENHRKKLSESHKGKIPWNKGIKFNREKIWLALITRSTTRSMVPIIK